MTSSNTTNFSSKIEPWDFDESQYGNFDNPLLQNGTLKDYNGKPSSLAGLGVATGIILAPFTFGLSLIPTIPVFNKMGTGIPKKDRADLLAAFQTAQTTIDASIIEAKATAYDAFTKATAAVETACIDANARFHEANTNKEIADGQQKTDRDIAEMEREVELAKVDAELEAIENVDKVNAEANLRASDALVMEASAKQTEADAELEEQVRKSTYMYRE